MPPTKRTELAAVLQQRIMRALQVGALAPGDRLPGTRELSTEFDADPRVITAAYRMLATDGLVEMRPRSGVYVHPSLRIERKRPKLSISWMAQLFGQGIIRGVRVPDLPRMLSNALAGPPLRAAVIASTIDQVTGLCRELHTDFGLDAKAVLGSTVHGRHDPPPLLRRSRLILATELHASVAERIAKKLGKTFVELKVRPDLFDAEWSLLRGESAYVLVADPRFAKIVRDYLTSVRAERTTRVLVVGRDDLSEIGSEAPVYATQAARDAMGAIRLPKGLLPPARMLSDECAVEVVRAMLEVRDAGERLVYE
jgi:DNA-binding transcriptional regulator YhcF (GntR family)